MRERAFRGSSNASEKVDTYVDALGTKEEFLKAVLNERKWEFAGENLRWKDLVRNNIYNQELYWTFMRYYSVAENSEVGSTFIDYVEEHDGVKEERYSADLPTTLYYFMVSNATSQGDTQYFPYGNYANSTLNILELANPYHAMSKKPDKRTNEFQNKSVDWSTASLYSWWNGTLSCPTNQVLYSLYGFMRGDDQGNIFFINNGAQNTVETNGIQNPVNMPVVRYILPYPQDAIERSSGKYANSYGY